MSTVLFWRTMRRIECRTDCRCNRDFSSGVFSVGRLGSIRPSTESSSSMLALACAAMSPSRCSYEPVRSVLGLLPCSLIENSHAECLKSQCHKLIFTEAECNAYNQHTGNLCRTLRPLPAFAANGDAKFRAIADRKIHRKPTGNPSQPVVSADSHVPAQQRYSHKLQIDERRTFRPLTKYVTNGIIISPMPPM